MPVKYCRKFLFLKFCVLLMGPTFIFANGDQELKLFTDEGERLIARENLIVLNEQVNIPEFKSIDREIQALLSTWGIKGAVVGIAKDEEIVYAKGYGFSDISKRKSVQPDHLFRLASISKLITATAVFKLIEEQKFTLDSKVFGENGLLNDSIYQSNIVDKRIEDITIRHLLNHTGGWDKREIWDVAWLPDFQLHEFLPGPYSLTSKLIAFTLNKGLEADPGTKSAYSNVGYIILGDVIQKLSGKTYDEYVRSEIFEPCKISDIFPGKSFEEDRYVDETMYYDAPGAKMRRSVFGEGNIVPGPYGSANIELLGASGGWVGSAREILKLVMSIDGMDHVPDILSAKSIEEMTTRDPENFPFGWMGVSEDSWWRTGTLSGTSAIVVKRNDGISYVMLVNTSTKMGNRFSYEMRKAIEKGLAAINHWPDRYNVFANYTYKEKVFPSPLPGVKIPQPEKPLIVMHDLAMDGERE